MMTIHVRFGRSTPTFRYGSSRLSPGCTRRTRTAVSNPLPQWPTCWCAAWHTCSSRWRPRCLSTSLFKRRYRMLAARSGGAGWRSWAWLPSWEERWSSGHGALGRRSGRTPEPAGPAARHCVTLLPLHSPGPRRMRSPNRSARCRACAGRFDADIHRRDDLPDHNSVFAIAERLSEQARSLERELASGRDSAERSPTVRTTRDP